MRTDNGGKGAWKHEQLPVHLELSALAAPRSNLVFASGGSGTSNVPIYLSLGAPKWNWLPIQPTNTATQINGFAWIEATKTLWAVRDHAQIGKFTYDPKNQELEWEGAETIVRDRCHGEGVNGTENLTAIAFLDDQHGLAVGYDGSIVYYNGEYWQVMVYDHVFPGLNSVVYVNSHSGPSAWAVGKRGTIVRASQSNWAWRLKDLSIQTDLSGVFFIDVMNGWAVGDNGVILNTTDGGDSWSPQNSGTNQKLRAVTFVTA